jgi:hypothetical protein
MQRKLLDFGRFVQSGAASAAVFPGPAQVRAYWEGLRQGGALPERTALDPRGLGGVLDRVFLADRIGRGLLQVRIAGSGLAEIAGTDLRGLPLSCLFAPEMRPLLADVLEAVAQGQRLAMLDLGTNRSGGRVVARLLMLPLTDGPDRRLVLGCLGSAGTLPGGKFHILARVEERIDLPTPAAVDVPPKPVPLMTRGHLALVHARD